MGLCAMKHNTVIFVMSRYTGFDISTSLTFWLGDTITII